MKRIKTNLRPEGLKVHDDKRKAITSVQNASENMIKKNGKKLVMQKPPIGDS